MSAVITSTRNNDVGVKFEGQSNHVTLGLMKPKCEFPITINAVTVD